MANWWLSEVMKPLISHAYEEVREEHGLTRKAEDQFKQKQKQKQKQVEPFEIRFIPPNIQTSLVGYLSLFNEHCKQKDLLVEWKYCDVPGGTKATPIWTVDVSINGEHAGTGQGHTKKTARNEAAKQGLKYLGVVLP